MIIPLELSPELAGQLEDGIARHDVESVRRILHAAVEPAAAALLHPAPVIDEEPIERLLDQLADEVASYLGPDHVPLSDYAVSRAGIYGDHA